MKIDFKEIGNWEEFEDLTAEYFRQVKARDNNIIDVRVEPTGNGSDSGRDILVTFRVNDSVQTFKRIWVVQCKFVSNIVKEKELATINIPGKIHQYGADGFLLVVKNRIHSNISKMIEDYRKNCWANYSYEFWTGQEFKKRIKDIDNLVEQFFPEYHNYTKRRELKLNKILK